MELSRAEAEKILKTLPIGYYIKRDIKLNLSDEFSSYYDVMNDKITISFPALKEDAKKLTNDFDIEKSIRCLLYHEVSHAMLTPRNLEMSDIINIFEDERIETLLKDYYLNVDFKEFLVRINDFKGEPPKSALEEFYQTVRYRIGKLKNVTQVNNIISIYRNLNSFSNIYDVNDYIRYIKELYKEICKDWDFKEENELSKSFEKKSNEENLNKESDKSFEENLKENSEEAENKGMTLEKQQELIEKIKENISSYKSDNLFEKALNKFVNNKYITDIDNILNQSKKITKHNGSAINSYSGLFDYRSVVREDYKYFLQSNRIGHNKAFSKTHLNLFIDKSGSFHNSEDIVNEILFALSRIEKNNPNFSFDLISIGIGQTIHQKNNRVLSCYGGNDVTKEIYSQFKQLQFPNTLNYNIVLFDGDAFSDTPYYKSRDTLKAFDTNNTVIISDKDNKIYLKNNNKSKIIITNYYTEELYKNIINALKFLMK